MLMDVGSSYGTSRSVVDVGLRSKHHASSTFFSFALDWKRQNPKVGSDIDGNQVIDSRDLVYLLKGLVGGPAGTPEIAMVNIASGSFLMGNSDSPRDLAYSFSNEFPRHEVKITRRLEVGVYEISNRQYADFLNHALSEGLLRNSVGGPYTDGDVYHNGRRLMVVSNPFCDIGFNRVAFFVRVREKVDQSDHPAGFVTWDGSIAFCNWLSEMNDLVPCYNLVTGALVSPNSGGYRLPSEAEWEFFGRGPVSNPNRYAPYSFGDDPTLNLKSCDRSLILDEYMVWCGNNRGWSEAVGIRRPNPYGLHDIHGNVWEWCQDAWHANYIGAPTDGSAWEFPPSNFRVVRGGSWTYRPQQCRSASRDFNIPNTGDFFIGFRVVRNPPAR